MAGQRGFIALCMTHAGIEGLAQDEIEELLPEAKTEILEPGVLRTKISSAKKVVKLCYANRLLERVFLQLSSVPFEGVELDQEKLLPELAQKSGISEWLEGKTFRANCVRSPAREAAHPDDGMPGSQELSGSTGAAVLKVSEKTEVNLDRPDIIVQLAVLSKELVLALDLSGFDLSKREYRVFEHSKSAKGTMGAALYRFCKPVEKGVVANPHGRAATLIIEAALSAALKPVHYFQKEQFLLMRLPKPFSREMVRKVMSNIDKEERDLGGKKGEEVFYYQDALQRYVVAAKKNAKLAGIDKQIRFSRTEMSWLDIRYDKADIKRILMQVPMPGRSNPRKEINDLLTELFYQAEYVLKKDGNVTLLVPDGTIAKKPAEKYDFVLDEELPVYQGMLPLVFQRWKKSAKRSKTSKE